MKTTMLTYDSAVEKLFLEWQNSRLSADRIRNAKFCDLGRKKEDHDCRKNFVGSAKAMEASAGADLVNNSTVLKEANLEARVLIGDEDSCTIGAVRRGNPKKIFKLADQNHLKKNFSQDLWKLSNFKEIKKNSIDHIKKCFSYALAQNVGDSKNLAKAIRNIPNHLYDNHENCGSWCCRRSGSGEQTILTFYKPNPLCLGSTLSAMYVTSTLLVQSQGFPGEYKLSELAKNHLNVNSDDKFHEALYDVEILPQEKPKFRLTDNKHLFESS
ncbi:hypothetical protein KQX54_012305 [Cotesia glomerata]|uniref:Mutator-like transposase domain-containing protein n=1 Tax=Cotesia glomerata TaxID=32391 RepID=A0AAV7IB63_COTGL|nr:hypothetical protein KQX54_012305 [Cotesia glomerata]